MNNHHSNSVSGKWQLGLLILISGFSSVQFAHAYHLSLWELGLGVGILNTQAYRGSKTETSWTVPVPYPIYRGDFLQVDQEDGVRGKLFEGDRIRFNLSIAGSLPVSDDDDGARADMPELDPLVEAGVELIINLWQNNRRNQKLEFVVPYRFVYSVGDPILEYQGMTLAPYINYDIRVEHDRTLMRYGVSFGPIYSDSKFHNYFYQVKPKFVTADREAFDAASGYSGSRVTISIARKTKNYFFGAYARYDNLDHAVFVGSPLVETTDYTVFGVIFAWIFAASDTTVDH